MSNQKTNQAVYDAVWRAVSWAVEGAVNRAPYGAVWLAVNEAMRWAVRDAVYEAVGEDPLHPGLQDFLLSIKGT